MSACVCVFVNHLVVTGPRVCPSADTKCQGRFMNACGFEVAISVSDIKLVGPITPSPSTSSCWYVLWLAHQSSKSENTTTISTIYYIIILLYAIGIY